MSNTTEIALRPRDGLTIKDPRGFNIAGGAQARSVPWPLPSTTAGAARTAIGFANGFASKPTAEEKTRWNALLQQVSVLGPFNLHRTAPDGPWSVVWPAPRDAVAFPGRHGRDVELVWLTPRPARGACGFWSGSDLERRATEALWRAEVDDRRKLVSMPRWWTADDFLAWMAVPGPFSLRTRVTEPLGRFDWHVKVKPDTYTAEDAALFGHDTHEYLRSPQIWDRDGNRKIDYDEIAIGLRVTCSSDLIVPFSMWRVGGEGRLARAQGTDLSRLMGFPHDRFDVPAQNRTQRRRFRIVLCTPASFESGWRPDWLAPTETNGEFQFRGTMPGTDLDLVLRAAMVDRPLVSSGWDFARGSYGEPKPSRRLVAAGAVYYFEVHDSERVITAEELERLWMRTLQLPGEQAARDGFGLAVPGEWPADVE